MPDHAEALRTIRACIDAGPFDDDCWDSFEQYQIPRWYENGKLGIFIHWGVYSVPAFGCEWYPREMYLAEDNDRRGIAKHHRETYGAVDQFGYKDFVPRFKAEHFDPGQWAALFKESGAVFVMPVAEHHDGFAMYDTAYNPWNAARMGPQRDIVRELSVAVRDRGMRFAVSSHREENYWFFNGGRNQPSDVQDEAYRDLYGPALFRGEDAGSPDQNQLPDQAWLDDWLVRTCELVDNFRPEVVFFDWWIQEAFYAQPLRTFAAYYYSRCREWGIEGAINYKNEAMPTCAGVFDVERGQLAGIRPVFWQTDTSVAYNSWSHVAGMEYRTAPSIIHDFIDIVSKNGGLLLNIGPRADGTIPDEQQALLRALGRWLSVNGDGIYDTRPWKIYGEGPTEVPEGMFAERNRTDFGASDIRFTTKAGKLYVHFMGWPETNRLTIRNFGKDQRFCPLHIASVELLGRDGALPFQRDHQGMHVALPSGDRPCEHAWTLRLTPG